MTSQSMPNMYLLFALPNCLPDQCRDDQEVLRSPHRTLCMSTTQDIPAKTDNAKSIQNRNCSLPKLMQ